MQQIIHFHNGAGGGVLSVIRNLVQYSSAPGIENHIIYTIDKAKQPDHELPDIPGAASTQVFYYSLNWNFYYTCRQLAKLIPHQQCLLVAHDWLELGMVSHLGLANPVVQFVHGHYDYYYRMAWRHATVIDAFVCVSATIREQLITVLPKREADIVYLKLPVPDIAPETAAKKSNRIVFIGRCEEEKGYPLLPLIAEQLHSKNYSFEWHIYGEGSLDAAKQSIWPADVRVQFYGVQPSRQLLQKLPSFDFLVLPTLAEGMPVTVIEAMKAGVIPVVNNLQGGLQELITNGETGFLINGNHIEQYVDVLQRLQLEPELTVQIAGKASRYARAQFDAVACTFAIEQFFLQHAAVQKKRTAQKIYGSKLDKKWLPNLFVKFVRTYVLQA